MKLAAVVIALVTSTSSLAVADPVIDLGPPSRELRLPTRIDFGVPTRGPTPAEPPARPVDPVPPAVPPTSVGLLGSLIGAPVMLYVLAKTYSGKARTASRDGWRRRRGSTGYASLVPDVRKIREVSLVPTATTQSVHTGISLRW